MTDLTQTQIDLLDKFTANGGVNFVYSTKNHTHKRDFFLMSPDVQALSHAGYIIQIDSSHSNRVYMVTSAGYVLLDSLSEFMQEDDSPVQSDYEALTQAQNDLLNEFAAIETSAGRNVTLSVQGRFWRDDALRVVPIINMVDINALLFAGYIYPIDYFGDSRISYVITESGYEYLESINPDQADNSRWLNDEQLTPLLDLYQETVDGEIGVWHDIKRFTSNSISCPNGLTYYPAAMVQPFVAGGYLCETWNRKDLGASGYKLTDAGYVLLESLSEFMQEDDSPDQSDYEAMLQCAGWIE